jgi:hypothetical protein
MNLVRAKVPALTMHSPQTAGDAPFFNTQIFEGSPSHHTSSNNADKTSGRQEEMGMRKHVSRAQNGKSERSVALHTLKPLKSLKTDADEFSQLEFLERITKCQIKPS